MDALIKKIKHKFSINKGAIAEALKKSAILSPRFSEEIINEADFVKNELQSLVHYLEKSIVNNSKIFKNLYLSERLKMGYSPNLDVSERNSIIKNMIETDRECLIEQLQANKDEKLVIDEFFEELIAPFESDTGKNLNVLFIGDCLHLDIVGFLIPELFKSGINLLPEYLTDKNHISCIKKIREYEANKFDLIFFSPFTYEFNQKTAPIINGKLKLKNDALTEKVFKELFLDTEIMIENLSSRLNAPIILHNSICISRHENKLKGLIKNFKSNKSRKLLRNRIDSLVDLIIEKSQKSSDIIITKFDECQFLNKNNYLEELKLGSYYYKSALQHPSYLGVLFAEEYSNICKAKSLLVGKKMVVTDLDNTLWEGLIGEGKVIHYHHKQSVLKNLKNKGVILSIASKNDPKNVIWEGSTLNNEDFVFKVISWDAKINAFPIFEKNLNLKKKDFVFIDDRPDEREMVSNMYPEILTLDATSSETWRIIEYWSELLTYPPDGDRTKMYHQRFERDRFLSAENDKSDEEELFNNLELKMTIKTADKKELSRVEELINRTNQFNINGVRVTKNKIADYHQSDKAFIYIANMSDKFGEMGIVSVLVAQELDDKIEIENFVLSCRVFGYKVENVLINRLKELSKAKGKPINAKLIKNQYNSPCHHIFSEHFFEYLNEDWIWNLNYKSKPNPTWFNL